MNENNLSLIFRDQNERLEVYAKRVIGGQLKALTVTQIDRRISEMLAVEVEVNLMVKENGTWHKVFKESG